MGACSNGTHTFLAEFNCGDEEWLEETDARVIQVFRKRIDEDRSLGLNSVYRLRNDLGIIQARRIGPVSGPTRGARVLSKFDPKDTDQVSAFLRARDWCEIYTQKMEEGRLISFVHFDPIEATALRETRIGFVLNPTRSGDSYLTLRFHTEWGVLDSPPVWVDTRGRSKLHDWMSSLQSCLKQLMPNARIGLCAHQRVWLCDMTGKGGENIKFCWTDSSSPCGYHSDQSDQEALEKSVDIPLVIPVVLGIENARLAELLPRKKITETCLILISNGVLRKAVHNAFRGKCQFCQKDVKSAGTRLEAMEIDHLFPRSKPIEKIRIELQKQGMEPAHVELFLARHWHGTHDCVLNYTLSCMPCNIKKSNDLLDVGVLGILFTRTQKQAAEVLAYVNARSY